MIVHTKRIKKRKDGLSRRAARFLNLSSCKAMVWWLWQLLRALPGPLAPGQHHNNSLPDFLGKGFPHLCLHTFSQTSAARNFLANTARQQLNLCF